MSKFNANIVYNGEKLEVFGEEYAASCGARESGTGLQLEPDEDASLEIESVIYEGVDVWGLLETAVEPITELVWAELYKQSESAAEDKAEAQYEAKKERGEY